MKVSGNANPQLHVTLILPASSAVWAYDRVQRRWCTEGGNCCQTFQQLGYKYPETCADFVEQLLRSEKGLLRSSAWLATRKAGGVTLTQVVCQFRKAILKLGCKEDILITRPGDGYEVLPRFIAAQP